MLRFGSHSGYQSEFLGGRFAPEFVAISAGHGAGLVGETSCPWAREFILVSPMATAGGS